MNSKRTAILLAFIIVGLIFLGGIIFALAKVDEGRPHWVEVGPQGQTMYCDGPNGMYHNVGVVLNDPRCVKK